MVIQRLSSRAVLLKPFGATLVGNGSGGKVSEGECSGDELEVERRHLSKMLQVKNKIKGLGIEGRMKE